MKKSENVLKSIWFNHQNPASSGIFFGLFFGCLFSFKALAQLPSVCAGTLIRHSQFPSQFVASRNIDVWLPAHFKYNESFGVMYMQDGQMLFDSNTTFNKQEWGVDETLTKLYQSRKIKNVIVVGIWNTPNRRPEYFPKEAFYNIEQPLRDSIQQDIGGVPLSKEYLKFIVTELKPFIDSVYRTKKDREHTFITGASSGALISWYALCQYPQIFKGAACLSNHWTGSVKRNKPAVADAFNTYLQHNLPNNNALLYLDCGTNGLDSLYEYGYTEWKKIEHHLKPSFLKTYSFRYKDAGHSELDWAKRLEIPFLFLLKTPF